MTSPLKGQEFYTARNPVLIRTLELARLLGANAAAILKDTGVDPSLAQSVGARLPSAKLIDAVENAAIQTGRADFGLLLGSMDDHRSAGPAGLLMEQASTVAEAMEIGNRFLHLNNNGWTMVWTRRPGGMSLLRLDFHAVGKYEPRHFVEGLVLEILRLAKQFLGAEWRAMAVHFKHKQMSPRETWQNYLGPNVLFKQDVIGIEFSANELARRVAPGEPEIRRRLEAMLHDLEMQRNGNGNGNLLAKTAELLRELLPAGRGTIEEIAERVAMTPRTLQRRLTVHDVTFRHLVATTRLAMAAEYIGAGLSPTQMAPLLGFSETSALSRFLRQHAGSSVRGLRARPEQALALDRKRIEGMREPRRRPAARARASEQR